MGRSPRVVVPHARRHRPLLSAAVPAEPDPIYVIGVGRSGTTLLRLMLDGHSRIAIPGEAPWVTAPPARLTSGDNLDAIITHTRFPEWRLDPAYVRASVARRSPSGWPDTVAAVFAAYAEQQGKRRWGDKTPTHIDHLPVLARWFPRAQFVHLVRDGRAVAASLAEQPWGPRNAMAAAFYWRKAVGRARRIGVRLGMQRYLELRLEDLVADAPAQLRKVCAFLGEEYEPGMLEYHNRFARRGRSAPPGHEPLALPPTPGLRDWRATLGSHEQRAVESICRPALRLFGYPVGRPSVAGWLRARADRAHGLALRITRG
jgi:Sulfotransferase family